MARVRNVHERVIMASADQVGALVDRLASDDDPIWPSPTWPPMRFDRPLGVGATGGHGPIRYSVSDYEPGRRLRCDFAAPDTGFHELTVHPLDADRCLIKHVLESDLAGADRLVWPVVVRGFHDVVIEEVFDNVQRAVGEPVPHPVRWSPWVRLTYSIAQGRLRARRRASVSGVTPRSP